MLIEFKVTNFRSIREEQTFSLVASNYDKNLNGCLIERSLPGMTGMKFLKGAAIYGPNASGKSNILDAIRFVAEFVKHSATRLKPGDITGVEPFRLDRLSSNQPSNFQVSFAVEGVRYVFGLAITQQRVIEEYLEAYPKGLRQTWYHRLYNSDNGTYNWSRTRSGFRRDKSLQDKTRENALFLSVAPQFNHPQLTPIFNWFKKQLRYLDLSGEAGMASSFTAKRVEEGDSDFREQVINLLRTADMGVTDITVSEQEVNVDDLRRHVAPALFEKYETESLTPSIRRLKINLLHKADNVEPIAFDYDDESAGTRRFFALVGPWIDTLKYGYTVFIDEIDTSLHPILVRELLKLLFCNEYNPNGAQVVFTTHNPILLDNSLMRRDQFWFSEKTIAGATHLYPLTDYQPRQDEALIKGYLAGRYGATPFLPEGLKLEQ